MIEKLLEKIVSMACFALVAWGIYCFFEGITVTNDVPRGFFLDLSPYFWGYANGSFYLGAHTLGAIGFSMVELFHGIPVPTIWPIVIGIFLWKVAEGSPSSREWPPGT